MMKERLFWMKKLMKVKLMQAITQWMTLPYRKKEETARKEKKGKKSIRENTTDFDSNEITSVFLFYMFHYS